MPRSLAVLAAAMAASLLAALAAAAAPLRPNSNAAALSSGDYEFSFRHDGILRRYRVHVPATYSAAAATPMVLALHGGGGNMHYQANDRNYGLITASERYGFVAVFPNGYAKNRRGLFATWNAGLCCGPARDENIDDVGFLRSVVARVKRQANIDPARVYSIGMSNGGLMSYRLACEAPDIIRGVMAVAGTDNTSVCAPQQTVPILHVHALNDDHVLYNGGAGEAAFRNRDAVTDFRSVPDTIEKWVRLNHAEPAPERVLSVPGAWCDLHRARPGGAPVKLCVTERGGHSWPGGEKARSPEPPSKAINANEQMWEFFSGL